MPLIELETFINASRESCFDLSLDIDLHIQSMRHTNEKAISGKTTGQISLGEAVQWKAKHFGIHFTMTMQITELARPFYFTDEMIKGPFKCLRHKHIFENTIDGTRMADLFEFKPPLGALGRKADLYLNKYMRTLLLKRNETIKARAELNKAQ